MSQGYNLRKNPPKRRIYSPRQQTPNRRRQNPNTPKNPNTYTMGSPQGSGSPHDEVIIQDNISNSERDDLEGFDPRDQDATESVRKLLNLPPLQPNQRLSLPSSSVYNPPVTNSVNVPRFVPSHSQQGPPLNSRTGLPNPYQVSLPPMYPFMNPPPLAPATNSLHSLIERLDRGYEENRSLRSQVHDMQNPIPPSDLINQAYSIRTSNQTRQPTGPTSFIPPNRNVDYERFLEQRVTTLSDQINNLTERLNSANIGTRRTQGYRVPPHEWKIRFNNMTAESFIYQITSLKNDFNYEWEDVLSCFHTFLDEEKKKWYWNFRSIIGDQFNWESLSAAILKKYGNRKTDEEIWLQMAERKQQDKEKFKDFYQDIEDIHSSCRVPRSDKALIRLIRGNIKLAIQKIILTYDPESLTEFIQKCDDCDQLLFPHLYKASPFHNRRPNLSAIEFPELSSEALAFQGCLNCGQTGHYVKQCKQPIQLACFKCNKKGFTVRTCPDCNSNFRVSEVTEEPPPQSP